MTRPAQLRHRVGSHDVFVSFAQHDRDAAMAVRRAMEAAGLVCWTAPDSLRPGPSYASQILTAITTSRTMVVIFSANANHSQQVLREVERAVHHGVPIIPVRVEAVVPSGDMEFFLSVPHWLDAFSPPSDHHLELLCEAVCEFSLKCRGASRYSVAAGAGVSS